MLAATLTDRYACRSTGPGQRPEYVWESACFACEVLAVYTAFLALPYSNNRAALLSRFPARHSAHHPATDSLQPSAAAERLAAAKEQRMGLDRRFRHRGGLLRRLFVYDIVVFCGCCAIALVAALRRQSADAEEVSAAAADAAAHDDASHAPASSRRAPRAVPPPLPPPAVCCPLPPRTLSSSERRWCGAAPFTPSCRCRSRSSRCRSSRSSCTTPSPLREPRTLARALSPPPLAPDPHLRPRVDAVARHASLAPPQVRRARAVPCLRHRHPNRARTARGSRSLRGA